jgi:hypothetical protein
MPRNFTPLAQLFRTLRTAGNSSSVTTGVAGQKMNDARLFHEWRA